MPSFRCHLRRAGEEVGPVLLEWGDTHLTVKHPGGEIVHQVELAAAHRTIDVFELYADNQIHITTGKGEIELCKNRKAAIALRTVIQNGMRDDSGFRKELDDKARVAVRRGWKIIAICAAPIAIHTAWTTVGLPLPGGSWRDVTYLALCVPVVVLLGGVVALHHGLQLKRLLRTSQPT
jgi:hypothetical protein